MIIKSLSKKYKDKVVLNNVSIQIEKRRSLGIIGENGAGKSTLINCILGVTKPTKGKVEYDFQKSEIWKHIGVQLQQQEFGNLLKVKEIINLFLTVYGLEKKHISDLLKKLKIENVYKQYASKLSNGEKQRLNILLTLMHNPTYLFFDELTTGLDALSRESITDFLVEKKQKGKTIVLVSHYFFEIWKLCDYVLMLKDGNNIFYGDKFEIANNEIDFEKKCKELLFKGRI